ncbi:transposase [Streptomyces sp. QHH-9511]|uniref:transposase n=1 Tax=Streptomyces sp. QHH-9511 TaxID=2684468 RepID=UPI0013182DA2|nr:transposase [Streptomyces sp. QHH-9511]
MGGRPRGRWRDQRQVLESIVFTFRTGLPWKDLSERFSPRQTVHGRFRPVGRRRAPSAASRQRPRHGRRWNGRSRSASRASELPRTRLPKGARRTRPRTLPPRTDRHTPPRLRRTRPAPGLPRHGALPSDANASSVSRYTVHSSCGLAPNDL